MQVKVTTTIVSYFDAIDVSATLEQHRAEILPALLDKLDELEAVEEIELSHQNAAWALQPRAVEITHSVEEA